MKAASRTVKQLFQTDVRFLVPMYQRPYVWSADRQWRPLFEDVVRLADRLLAERQVGTVNGKVPEGRTPRHFLGALVVDQEGSVVGEVDRRLVIDGQQRLTTLQLLLSVVRAKAESSGDTRSAAQLRKLVENGEEVVDPARPEEQWKVWPTNSDRGSFVEVMAGRDSSGTSRFAEAWRFFSDSVDAWLIEDESWSPEERLLALVAMLQSHLEVVAVELEKGDNAQVIFETLNDRGEPLLAADLVKNYVFQHLLPASNSDRIYEDRWKQFDLHWWREEIRQGRLKRPRIDVFLQHWLVLKTQSEVLVTELFNSFKDLHRNSGIPVEKILDQLHRDSEAFQALEVAARDRPHSIEGTFVHRWRTLELTAFTPIVIRLFSLDVEAADRQRGLLALESWMVRRALCGSTAKDINRFAIDLVTWLTKADGPPGETLERLLLEATTDTRRWPADAEVSWALTNLPLYGRLVQRRVVMVLEAVEDDIRRERHAEQPAPRNVSLEIEHVMPRDWRSYWRTGPMTDAEMQQRDRRIQELGNLTLVTGKVNKVLTNHPWTEAQAVLADAPVPRQNSTRGKRNVLAQSSTLLLNADLYSLHPDEWTEETIVDRTVELLDRILRIWPRTTSGDDEPTWEPPPTRVDAWDAPTPEPSAHSSVGRRLDSLPDGLEVFFRGSRGIVSGRHLVVDGTSYESPSAAAAKVANGVQNNGWRVWKTAGGVSLADLHDGA